MISKIYNSDQILHKAWSRKGKPWYEIALKEERMKDGIFVSDDLMEVINSTDSINNKFGSLKLRAEENVVNG